MPVFNAAANQVLISPVSAARQGKAARQQLEQGEVNLATSKLQKEALKMEIDAQPARMEAAAKQFALEEQNLRADIAETQVNTSQKLRDLRKDVYGPVINGIHKKIEAGEYIDMAETTKAIRVGVEQVGGDELASFNEAVGDDHQFDENELAMFMGVYGIEQELGAPTSHQKNIDSLVAAGAISREEGNDMLKNIELKAGTVVGRTEGDMAALGGDASTNTMGAKMREVMGATDNLMFGLDRITELIADAPQASLGLPGDVTAFVDQTVSAANGFAELAGGWAEINGEEVPAASLLDANLYKDYFQGAAATNAALQANAIGVSYSLARSANPDGRISDADVRHQLERLNLGQSSKTQMFAAMKEVKRTTLGEAMNWLKHSGATETPEGRSAYSSFEGKLSAMDGSVDEGPQAVRGDEQLIDADGKVTHTLSEDGTEWTPVNAK